ncbi:putative GDH/6PGL endoplasmic bifunctional protein [Apostichopus japonicus]|uniref:Putative GDH/6PGL endoplasmic bifunctional protein n=1 Tax=Stichopus japonicus TaxID=307972 RepID=A0A2G8JR01_STIJA|nr:putative GDH/6PGL endoplasmic bifunctional protein [Apostichopus japonicus]
MYLRTRWKRVFLLGIGIFLVLLGFKTYALDEQTPVANVVLIGATGDLAKKYLWQGFFNLFRGVKQNSLDLHFTGGTRLPFNTGNEQLTKILQDSVNCQARDEECLDSLHAFLDRVDYAQLKTADHYRDLCTSLTDGASSRREEGRIFYLSVPPFAYPEIVEHINQVCRPPDPRTWLKVVLEKPFGSSLNSAQELSVQLSKHLKEEEIYRIDHYLGKPGVRTILPFRHSNRDVLDPLWNHKYIDYIEIAMKETLDVKGRLSFYDKYGVIRDVMQNHLTEILGLVAMEIPNDLNPASVQKSKVDLFKDVLPVTSSQSVIGQYENYAREWMEETNQNPGNVTFTPTFAASILFINNQRWRGVPFVLMSGKKLLEKLSYVKVVFKNQAVCPTSVSWRKDSNCEAKQIVFVLSQSGSKYPHILLSKSFPKPILPRGIREDKTFPMEEFQVFNRPLSDYRVYAAASEDAYTSLIKDCFHGDRSNFVDTERLMASWVIWDNALKGLQKVMPRIYSPLQSQTGWLNFEVKGQTLQYTVQETHTDDYFQSSLASSYEADSSYFRNQPLYHGNAETTIEDLAKSIFEVAVSTVESKGKFHIAFPGGNSPKTLFSLLASRYRVSFPWENTHIWMVDERCVPRADPRSNFNSLQELLLRHIAIPHFNVHPMPTELINGLCNPEDKGPQVYAAEMSRHLERERLDFVVLGSAWMDTRRPYFQRAPH